MTRTLMLVALGAFAAGALAGIFLAARHFMRKRLPASIALAHGLGGATGFALVLLVVVMEPAFDAVRNSLYLFIVTVALGVINLLFHVRRVRHRTSLIVLHALAAVSGVGTLIHAIVVYQPAAAAPPPSAAPSPSAVPSSDDSSDLSADAPGTQDAPTTAAAPSGSSDAPAAASSVAAGTPPKAGSAAPAPAPAGSADAKPSTAPAGEASGARPAVAGSDLVSDPAARAALTETVPFGSNSSKLLADSLPALERIASALKAHPEIELVEVQGHADGRGADGHNLALTRERAAAVVDALVTLGVDKSRLRSAGYGALCPADPACGADDAPSRCLESPQLKLDRRVVFVPLRAGGRDLKGEIVCERAASLIPAEHRGFHAAGRD